MFAFSKTYKQDPHATIVFKVHSLACHSTLGSSVLKKRRDNDAEVLPLDGHLRYERDIWIIGFDHEVWGFKIQIQKFKLRDAGFRFLACRLRSGLRRHAVRRA